MNPRRAAPARRRRAWPLLLALALVLFLVLLRMPARYPAALLNSWCAERCRLAQTEGPWWAGRGQLHVQSPSGGWRALGPLAWSLWPGVDRLLELQLAGGRITLRLGGAGLQAEIDGLQLPAELVLAQPALGLPSAGWQGQLRLSGTRVQLARLPQWQGNGQLDWLGASSSLLENQALGDLALRWTWDAHTGLQAQLQGGRAGQIHLKSELGLTPPQTGRSPVLSLQGRLFLAPPVQQALDKYLRLLGQNSAPGSGNYQLAWPPGAPS